ncbi:SDR family NAD(P)-dependent oxidoreductase [Anaerosporobacter sp.]
MEYTLITGASGGIGYELATECARHGENLILVARNREKLEKIKNRLMDKFHVSIEIISKDLAKPDAVKELHELTTQREYRVNCLINNAGFGDASPFLSSDWKRQSEMVQLNITALMQMTYLYGNDMKQCGRGKILNLSSVAAFLPGPNMSIYYASKSFVLSFSMAVAEELKGSGVSVTVICPGPTNTGFEKAANMQNASMFTFMKAVSADRVARKAYQAMQKGKMLVYHSPQTWLVNLGSRIGTRNILTKCAKRVNG